MRSIKVFIVLVVGFLTLVCLPRVVLAGSVSVTGKAKVLNTANSYIDFTNYNSNAVVDDATGNFSGYAFLEDLGWIDFGTTDNSLGPVNVNLTSGVVTGKAKSINTGAYLDFTNYNSNVTVNITTGIFSGFAFSEGMGWIDFSDTGVSTASTLDVVLPLSFDLNSPEDNYYTTAERPIFKWKSTTDATSNIASYSLEVDNGDTGDFSFDGIPASRTSDWETAKYLAHYENFSDSDSTNNYISVYTKSTDEWGSDNNDGKVKEGKRIWKVKAKDDVGNERIESRTLFVDRTNPSIEVTQVNDLTRSLLVGQGDSLISYATLDTTPTIFGKITDLLAGDSSSATQNSDGSKVASGPKNIEVKIEKKGFSGLYDLHSLAKVNTKESFWSDTDEKIKDNNENRADKYSIFSFTPTESLPLGVYKISITGIDIAGNSGSAVSFNIKITTPAKITKTIPIEEKEIRERIEKGQETVIEIPVEETVVVRNLTTKVAGGFRDFYWNVVGAVKSVTGYTASLWQGYADFVIGTNQKALAFVGGSYNTIAQKAPGAVGKMMFAIRNAGQTSSNNIAYTLNSVAGFMADKTSRPLAVVGNFGYRQKVKLLSIGEILFDKNPTVITNVKIAEVGKDYAIITWETNHYTKNNKVNYGESLSYGQEALSQERARDHKFRITDLEPDKKYFFEVMSQNNNYVYDAYYEFVTLGSE